MTMTWCKRPVIATALSLLLLLVVLCATTTANAASDATAVKVLKTSTFDKELASADVAFVKFYAPWCGHCKALAPVFVEAAETLKDEAMLAEIDCTVEKALAQRFQIKGFPTLILFKKGVEAGRYEGPREASDLVRYVRSQLGDALHPIATADELLALKEKAAAPLCVVKTASANSSLAQLAAPLAESMRDVYTFALVTDAAVLPDAAMESVSVMRPNDEVEAYSGDVANESALRSFLKIAMTPYFGEINAQTYRMYVAATERSMGWLFLSKDSNQDLKKLMVPIAQKHRDQLVLCWLNADLYGAVGQQMALPTNTTYPAFVIEHNKQHHIHPLDTPVDETSIAAYIERFLRGEATPTLMSQPVPEPETTDGLTTFVGSTLPKYTTASGKDVLVFFYAPWCQHCKNLHPVYEKIAKYFAGSEGLVIGKLDITANNFEANRFTVDGIPTLYFVPANGEPILYTGARTEEALKEFVQSHATTTLHTNEQDASTAKSGGEDAAAGEHDDDNDDDEAASDADAEHTGSGSGSDDDDEEGKDDL